MSVFSNYHFSRYPKTKSIYAYIVLEHKNCWKPVANHDICGISLYDYKNTLF